MGEEFEVSEDGKEALQDISAIGQISPDFEEDADEEEGEKDYLELVEYIRIAVYEYRYDIVIDRQWLVEIYQPAGTHFRRYMHENQKI